MKCDLRITRWARNLAFTGPGRSAVISALVIGLALFSFEAAAPAQAARLPEGVLPDVEEARLERALPGSSEAYSRQIIAQSGLQPVLERFSVELQRSPQHLDGEMAAVVRSAGQDLWRTTLDNAQGRNPEYQGDPYEDRGLYWARLSMRKMLKDWVAANVPGSSAMLTELDGLLRQLERSSRGLDDLGFQPVPGAARVMISGFDPFLLDQRLTMANPSGAAVLSLSGRVLQTPSGPVQVQAVMLPVTWSGFDTGIVEDAYGPWLQRGPADAQIAMTISQGGSRFDIERWAGAWRSGAMDNLNEGTAQGYRQEIPAAPGWPQTQQSPQFIGTTLPVTQMQAQPTGPYSVNYRQSYCAATSPLRLDRNCSEGVPPDNAYAVSGSGGDYLSNESMYRVNRLRAALGREDIAGGHLHVPILDYSGTQSTGSSEQFRLSRQNVAEQTRELIELAATAVR